MTNGFWARFLLPGFVWLAVFFAVPFVIVVLISLGVTNDLGGVVYGWHPGNYADALDPLFAPVLLRSVGYALATALLCLAHRLPGRVLHRPLRRPLARRAARRRAPALPHQLPRPHLRVGRPAGRRGAREQPAARVRSASSTRRRAVVGGLVYGYLGFMIIPVYASLERMDPSLIEAGRDLYGTPRETFWHVTWPQTRPGVLAGSVLVFLPAVGDFVSAQLLGGPDTYMIGNLIQQQFTGAENWPFGAALTIVLMLFLLVFITALPAAGGDGGGPRVSGFERPRFLAAFTALVYVWLFAPILVVILFSFNSGRSLQVFSGFSLRWYETFLEDESLRESLVASLQIAAATTVIATVLGTSIAIGLARFSGRWSPATGVLLLIPLVTPEIVAGVSAFVLFTQVGLALSLTTIILAHITFSISYVAVVVRGRLASIGTELEEAALDLGATPWQAVRLVMLPALWPAIAAAAMLVFAFSFDDFVLSFFTTGEQPQPLPVRIYSALRFGISPTINAIGTLMLVVSVALVGLALALPRLLGRRESGLAVVAGSRSAA